ncbi:MAG: diversity-generating retroelement protein bAvd family protein, partial [Bacteroidales bacterium]|nr:diversity-generating retroelement protein bAvd family protein [Bacteroidales bacterium]
INIYWANTHKEKGGALTKARNHLELVRLYYRIIKDLKQISIEKFVEINDKIESISKQLYAWQKSIK